MTIISSVQWISGDSLLDLPPADKATAIIAIKDYEKGNYFILPEIFSYDEKLKNFTSEQHGMPQNTDFWYMLESELLFPFGAFEANQADYAVGKATKQSQILYS